MQAGEEAAAAGEELEPLFDYKRVQPTVKFRFDGTHRRRVVSGGLGFRSGDLLYGFVCFDVQIATWRRRISSSTATSAPGSTPPR